MRLDAIRRLKLRIGSIGEIQHTFISDRVTNTAQIVCTVTRLREKSVKPALAYRPRNHGYKHYPCLHPIGSPEPTTMFGVVQIDFGEIRSSPTILFGRIMGAGAPRVPGNG